MHGRCQVCDAPESGTGAADLPPAVPPVLRISDVLAELRAIGGGGRGPDEVEAACRRVEALFRRLRDQFVADVVLSDGGFLERPSPARGGSSFP